MKRDEFLKSQKVLRLATIGDDGPHIVPVWYRFFAKKIQIGTHTRTQKIKNIRKNPSVSFCVDMGINSPIFGVMGKGDASLILEKTRVIKIAKKILQRYFDSINDESAKELLDDTDCIIEIIPKKFTVWSY